MVHFKYQFYQQTGGVTIGGPASSTTAEIICRLMNRLQYLRHYTLQKFGNDLLITFIPFLNVCTWKTFFHHINNLHQNIKFTMEEGSKGELAFLGTLFKRNNEKISVLVYRKPTHTDHYLHYSSHNQTSCKESTISSLSNRACSIITKKYDLTK